MYILHLVLSSFLCINMHWLYALVVAAIIVAAVHGCCNHCCCYESCCYNWQSRSCRQRGTKCFTSHKPNKKSKKKRKNRIEKNGIEYGTKKIEYLGVLYFSPICIVVGRNENAEYFIPIRSGYPTPYSILWPFDEPVKRSKSDGPTGGPLLYIYYCISPVEWIKSPRLEFHITHSNCRGLTLIVAQTID